MASSIKRDGIQQSWEETEFPLVCETCLGDNPYVRMTKEPYGKKCQVCETPFTVFAWQAGTKGRLKRVEICKACAQAKNVCQVCIYDLQFGLPVKVRDRVLRETGGIGAGGGVSSNSAMIPQSHPNQAWTKAMQQQQQQGGAAGGGSAALALTPANALAHAKLSEMAQMEPRYERNLPKLCSFFARGECDRGANCPFRHEMPRDRNDPLAKQNTKDRFYGTSDPVANKILGRQRKHEESQQQKLQQQDEEGGYNRARATLYLRFQGDAPYPPLTEMNIRDQFYAFGEIVSVRVQADKGQAFVEYTQPEATELAIASMNRKELLGRSLFVAWARAPKHGEQTAAAAGGAATAQASSGAPVVVQPMAPPGGGVRKAAIPAGLVKTIKPPPEVLAAAAAAAGGSVSKLSSVPRPGGGPIRGVGAAAAKRVVANAGGGGGAAKPYYPSADPSRLGSKTAPSSTS